MVCFFPSGSDMSDASSGLELARLADLPATVLTEGRRVATSLAETEARDQEQSQTSKISIRRKALLRVTISHLDLFLGIRLLSMFLSGSYVLLVQLRAQLSQALDHSELPERELTIHLARLQRDMVKVLRETL